MGRETQPRVLTASYRMRDFFFAGETIGARPEAVEIWSKCVTRFEQPDQASWGPRNACTVALYGRDLAARQSVQIARWMA